MIVTVSYLIIYADIFSYVPNPFIVLRFRGERIARFIPPGSRRKRRSDAPIISTVYDNPANTDEPDELLERKNPHNIKHRHSVSNS